MAPRLNEKDATGRTVVLNNVRLSFGDTLNVKRLPKKVTADSRATHGCNFILERGQPEFEANKAAVVAALQNAAKEFKRPENWWETLMSDDPKSLCLRKGNSFKDKNNQPYKGYADNLIIAAKGPRGGVNRPKIKDRNKKDVAGDFNQEVADVPKINEVAYNGAYGDAIISFYATDNGGTARITCSVEAFRSYERGEKLGGGGVFIEDDDFDDLENDDGFEPSKPSTGLLDI
jgi:hypothetical protein